MDRPYVCGFHCEAVLDYLVSEVTRSNPAPRHIYVWNFVSKAQRHLLVCLWTSAPSLGLLCELHSKRTRNTERCALPLCYPVNLLKEYYIGGCFLHWRGMYRYLLAAIDCRRSRGDTAISFLRLESMELYLHPSIRFRSVVLSPVTNLPLPRYMYWIYFSVVYIYIYKG
jgi:hypothetical protein